jgi:electron transfer flavoprotein alpha subunit
VKALFVFKNKDSFDKKALDYFDKVFYASFLNYANAQFVPPEEINDPINGCSFLSSIPDILSFDSIIFSDETVVKETAMFFAGKNALGLIAHSSEIKSNNGTIAGYVLGWDNFEALVGSKTKPSLLILSNKQGINDGSCKDSPHLLLSLEAVANQSEVKFEKSSQINLITRSVLPPNPLAEARTVVCVGRGAKENLLPKIKEFASLINAEICCTRPVCDVGLFEQERVVGDTGVSIKPSLYIAFGVSGAIQHLASVNAKHIIAFNSDPEAPIFSKADLAINQNVEDVIDELLAWAKNFSK